MKDSKIDPLLTPEEVGELLNIKKSTVYEQRHKLGGFYPAGIRVLRFRRDVINVIMEGRIPEGLAIQIHSSGKSVSRPGIQNQNRRPNRPGGPPERSAPPVAIFRGDPNIFGLFDNCKHLLETGKKDKAKRPID